MPIRQERMIALINAAIEYRAELQRVIEWISNRALDRMTHDELRAEIQTMGAIFTEAGRNLAMQHSNAIFMEFTNFYKNQRINTRNKAAMALKRREAGIPQRAQPLHHFDETDKLAIRHDLLDQPRPLHIRRPTRIAETAEEALQLDRLEQTAEEALQLEKQITELGAADPEPISEIEEADAADAPFRSPDGTPKPLFGNITNGILDQDEDESE